MLNVVLMQTHLRLCARERPWWMWRFAAPHLPLVKWYVQCMSNKSAINIRHPFFSIYKYVYKITIWTNRLYTVIRIPRTREEIAVPVTEILVHNLYVVMILWGSNISERSNLTPFMLIQRFFSLYWRMYNCPYVW